MSRSRQPNNEPLSQRALVVIILVAAGSLLAAILFGIYGEPDPDTPDANAFSKSAIGHAALLVVLVAGPELRLEAEQLEELARAPRVLAVDPLAAGEGLAQARARVAQVADGRRDDEEGAAQPFASFTAAVSAGTISKRSPTTPTSATSKIGARGSLLMATMKSEPFMPTTCWMAPEIPQAT